MSDYCVQIYRPPYINPVEIDVNSYDEGVDFVRNPRRKLDVPLKRHDLICVKHHKPGVFSYVNSRLKVIQFDYPLLNVEEFLGRIYANASLRFAAESIAAFEYKYAINVFWHYTKDVRILMIMSFISGLDSRMLAKAAYDMLHFILVASNVYFRKEIEDIIKPFVTNESVTDREAGHAIHDLDLYGNNAFNVTGKDEYMHLFWAAEVIPSIRTRSYDPIVRLNHFGERLLYWCEQGDDEKYDRLHGKLIEIFHKNIKLEDVLVARYR